jgi:hypothetical protein
VAEHSAGGFATSFNEARANFETAWQGYLAQCTEADFVEHRRQRDWTAQKYAMWERGERMPTQTPSPNDAMPLRRDLQQPPAGTHDGSCAAHHCRPVSRRHPPMKYASSRPFADPEVTARKLLEIAIATEAPQEGRIHIEKINGPFLFKEGGSPAEYTAGLELAIQRGWLWRHESGTYVKFTPAGAELFA